MEGCTVVFHTASPFNFKVTDSQRGFVDPALKGTRNVLDSVNKTESVKRVVLTSSCVAIVGDTIEIAKYPDKTITEDMWNTTSTVNNNPYGYSKSVAEKLAWEMNEKQEKWKLVVINPSFVMGPTLSATSTSGTHGMIGQLADGTMKSGAPPFEIGMVDVKDVAEAHFNAAYLEDASGRHILSNKTLSMVDLANIIRNKFGDKWLLPKKAAPKWLIWLIGPIIDKSISRKMISNNMGHSWLANNSKSINKLGIKYSPLEDCIEEYVPTND